MSLERSAQPDMTFGIWGHQKKLVNNCLFTYPEDTKQHLFGVVDLAPWQMSSPIFNTFQLWFIWPQILHYVHQL